MANKIVGVNNNRQNNIKERKAVLKYKLAFSKSFLPKLNATNLPTVPLIVRVKSSE